jgi:hypothetical protein
MSGHQRAPTTIDDSGTGRVDGLGRNRLDQVTFDKHAGILDAGFIDAVEDVNVGEKCLRRRIILRGRR